MTAESKTAGGQVPKGTLRGELQRSPDCQRNLWSPQVWVWLAVEGAAAERLLL